MTTPTILPEDLSGLMMSETYPYVINYARFYLKWGEAPVEKSIGLYGEQVRTIPTTLPEKTITCNGETQVIPYNLEPQIIEFNFDSTYTLEFYFDGDYVEDIVLIEVVTGVLYGNDIEIQSLSPEIDLYSSIPLMNPVGSVDYNVLDGTILPFVELSGNPSVVSDTGTNVLNLQGDAVYIRDTNLYEKWEVKSKDTGGTNLSFQFMSATEWDFRTLLVDISYTEITLNKVHNGVNTELDSLTRTSDNDYHVYTINRSMDGSITVLEDGVESLSATDEYLPDIPKFMTLYGYNGDGVYIEYLKAYQDGSL